MGKPKTKRLWGRDINIVKNGLDEEQVVELISELMIQRETAAVASFETPDRQDSSAKSDIAAAGEDGFIYFQALYRIVDHWLVRIQLASI